MSDKILTIKEAAGFLRVDVEVVAGLLESGDLPGRKIGEKWRTTKRALVCYVEGVPLHVVCCTPEDMASGKCCTPNSEGCC